MTRLYRFYNMEKSEHGSPFALCDECRSKQRIPEVCVLECIAGHTEWLCTRCSVGVDGEPLEAMEATP